MVKSIDPNLFPVETLSRAGKLATKQAMVRQIKEILDEDKDECSPYLDFTERLKHRTAATKAIIDLFLIIYANLGNISAATNYLPISYDTIQGLKKEHPRFKEACEDAKRQFQASLIEEATRRGRDGVDETVYFKDQKIGVKTVYSDRLMEKLLDGFGGERFKKTQDSGGPGGTTINLLLSDGTVLGKITDGNDNTTVQLPAEALPDAGVEVHGAEAPGGEGEEV